MAWSTAVCRDSIDLLGSLFAGLDWTGLAWLGLWRAVPRPEIGSPLVQGPAWERRSRADYTAPGCARGKPTSSKPCELQNTGREDRVRGTATRCRTAAQAQGQTQTGLTEVCLPRAQASWFGMRTGAGGGGGDEQGE